MFLFIFVPIYAHIGREIAMFIKLIAIRFLLHDFPPKEHVLQKLKQKAGHFIFSAIK